MPAISTLIIARNAASTIVEVVQAALSVSDEVVVVDSGSNDGTDALAQQAGARLVRQEWLGYGPQKNFGATCLQHEWVLSLDADEVLSAELATSIAAFAKTRPTPTHVWGMLRITDYCGQWVRHGAWSKDHVWRLYHRSHARWNEREVHEKLMIAEGGERHLLAGELLHHSYPDKTSFERKREPYLQLSVRALAAAGERATWAKLHLAPAWRWIRGYVLRRGFLDGRAGWEIAAADFRMVKEKYRRLAEVASSAQTGRS